MRRRDVRSADDVAALEALGCQVVRVEEPAAYGAEPAVLGSILDFIGPGDQLVVARLEHLSASSRAVLAVIARLEARRASLYIAEPELCSQGVGGRALRAALQAVAAIEPPSARQGRRPAAAQEIRALQRAGIGPVEIARRLGVSRMTVWRKLKRIEAQA